jgi:hypothetical protein
MVTNKCHVRDISKDNILSLLWSEVRMKLEIQFGYGGINDENCLQHWCGKNKVYDLICEVKFGNLICKDKHGADLIVGSWVNVDEIHS